MALSYNELLKSIQSTTTRLAAEVKPEDPVIEIKWGAREIILPKALQSFIAV